MPRLFTAIEIPEPIARHLAMLRGGLPGARWIDPENFHVTLRFVGDVDRRMAVEIASAVSQEEAQGFSVRLNGLDTFGGSKPHSIHVRVDRTDALMALQARHERIMRRIGLKAETRKFVPHVTLARLRGARQGDIAKYLSLRAGFVLPPFEVKRIVLYSSRNSVGGGPYVVEQVTELTGSEGSVRPRGTSDEMAATRF